MQTHQWLSHVTPDIVTEARGTNLDAYLLAVEGWRRGLELRWSSRKVKKRGVHAPGRLFTLTNGNKTHTFYKTRGDHCTQQAVDIGNNKNLTKEWLSERGVQVPEGKRFLAENSNDEIINYAADIEYPVVLKPTKGDQGVGVVANIKNEEHLIQSLKYVRGDLKFSDVLLEKFIEGEEYRIFVVDNKVIAAIKRIPANVVGDGISTIRSLIAQKNKERKKNPRLYSCLIKIDHEVESFTKMAGFTLDSIPNKGEQIFLRANTNVSTGGDSVDVLDELPMEIKNVAIKTLQVMPGLPHAGVDVIINQNAPIEKAGVVIEINPVPQIGSLVFPMIGQARDVPGAIIDYYFPETKDKKIYNPNVYFDLKVVLEPLLNKTASEVIVTPPPLEEVVGKKYVVSGDIKGDGYARWIRKIALEADLFGYIKALKNGNYEIIVGGTEEAANTFKNKCTKWKSKNIKVVSEETWKKPIKVGYQILKEPDKTAKQKPAPPKPAPKQKKKLTWKQKIKILIS
ncbi:ATP-grasp domain-containing protein [Lederbergia panacisoli]|uniref:ATP-grasp domain-containing protein n=1 Tax=Lederbergia panacisoli TaxID=1255251 RepID=UPI00214CBFFB|nr:ATP-grasp domain-containing protein [Lederbergia panacisoli]MCR2821425.1 ATP-grasp domain-containing protein [Lederbergia panacisoli]